jgi:hypothetical protein
MKTYVEVEVHEFLTSILDGNKSASRPGPFTSGKITHGTLWRVGGVGLGVDLDAVKERKSLCPCRESNFDSLIFQPVA